LIDVLDDLGSVRLAPEGLRQTPVQDHGVFGSGASALNGLGKVFEFPEVFLGKATALAVFPPPLREIIIGAAMDGLGFESLHVASGLGSFIFRA